MAVLQYYIQVIEGNEILVIDFSAGGTDHLGGGGEVGAGHRHQCLLSPSKDLGTSSWRAYRGPQCYRELLKVDLYLYLVLIVFIIHLVLLEHRILYIEAQEARISILKKKTSQKGKAGRMHELETIFLQHRNQQRKQISITLTYRSQKTIIQGHRRSYITIYTIYMSQNEKI